MQGNRTYLPGCELNVVMYQQRGTECLAHGKDLVWIMAIMFNDSALYFYFTVTLSPPDDSIVFKCMTLFQLSCLSYSYTMIYLASFLIRSWVFLISSKLNSAKILSYPFLLN